LAWRNDDGVLLDQFGRLFLFFLSLAFELWIYNDLCYFLLEILYFNFELFLFLAKFVPWLSETVNHDIAGDFKKKIKDFLFASK